MDEFNVPRDELDVTRDEFDVSRDKFNVARDEFDVTRDEFDVTSDELDVTSDEFDVTREDFDVTKDEFDNRASSSFTPPPEHRPTVHPNPAVPSTLVSKRKEVSFSAMTHVPAVYPVTDALPPSPAPMAVPFCNFSIGRLRCVRSAASSYANVTPCLHCVATYSPYSDERLRSYLHY
ncbi:hypothetical protein CDL15_Pgr023826 [Punica granatum]|uniref:Uncharacterized protein n=1 Tax=Punica granatum TaxID=22663 RepID=A0A218VYS2_PUNGR|nr:hypothetical protein CDL15_Pgr023826 [Punica granatum]